MNFALGLLVCCKHVTTNITQRLFQLDNLSAAQNGVAKNNRSIAVLTIYSAHIVRLLKNEYALHINILTYNYMYALLLR